MVDPIKNSSSTCCYFITEPYHAGIGAIKNGFNPEKRTDFFLGTEFNLVKHNSLKDRVCSVVIGLVLLIPIINYIVLLILKAIGSSYLPSSLKNPLEANDAWINETPSSPEEAVKRQEVALKRIQEIQNMGDGAEGAFEVNTELLTFSLDDALRDYSIHYDPLHLVQLFEYAEVERYKLDILQGKLSQYRYMAGGLTDPGTCTRKYLSQLFDFLAQTRRDVDPRGERLLKAKLVELADKVIDAHIGCLDQTLIQVKEMMLEVLDKCAEAGALSGRLTRRASVALYRYKSHLFHEICVKTFPDAQHQADIVREVEQQLIETLGVKGGVYQASLAYNPHTDKGKLEEVIGAFTDAFRPLTYLCNVLCSYHNKAEQVFRNDLLLWTRTYFGLETEDETHALVLALSVDKEHDAITMGGTVTKSGLLFLLEKVGIIKAVNK